jgi:HlyD family secretion protein
VKKKTNTKKAADEVEVVFVLVNNQVQLREVKSGVQNDKVIEIKSGIALGEEVVSAPFSAITRTLKNNDKVKKVNKDELFEVKPE